MKILNNKAHFSIADGTIIQVEQGFVLVDKEAKNKLKQVIICLKDGFISEQTGVKKKHTIGICEFENGNDGSVWKSVLAANFQLEGIPLLVKRDEVEEWMNKLQPDYDTKEGYQHGFFDAIEVIKKFWRDKAAQKQFGYSEEDIERIVDNISEKIPELRKLPVSLSDHYAKVRYNIGLIVKKSLKSPIPTELELEVERVCNVNSKPLTHGNAHILPHVSYQLKSQECKVYY